MRIGVRQRELQLDAFHFYCGVGLSVTLLFTLVFLCLVLENDNFLILSLSNDRSGYLCGRNVCAYLNTAFVGYHYYVQVYGVAFVCVQLFKLYDIAYRYLVLLVSIVDNSVHKSFFTSSFQSRRMLGAAFFVKNADLKKPVSIGSTITISHSSLFRQAFLPFFYNFFLFSYTFPRRLAY